MARPAQSELIKARRVIIALNDEDFEEIVEQIEIIREIREEEKKRVVSQVRNAMKENTHESGTNSGN